MKKPHAPEGGWGWLYADQLSLRASLFLTKLAQRSDLRRHDS